MIDDWQRYRPLPLEEQATRVCLINEPLPPPNVTTLALRSRPLHAVLCEALTNTQSLLTRLETVGVQVAKPEQREVVRLLYVATRHQLKALSATLELDGLE